MKTQLTCKIRIAPVFAKRSATARVFGMRERHSAGSNFFSSHIFLPVSFFTHPVGFWTFLYRRRGTSLGQHVFEGPRCWMISIITFSNMTSTGGASKRSAMFFLQGGERLDKTNLRVILLFTQ
jgi:hypothetical protein